MSKSETSCVEHLLLALNTFKTQYREALLENCNDEDIKTICECILNVFKGKIHIKETSESTFNICKIKCFFSTDVM